MPGAQDKYADIENNSVRAKILEMPHEYKWSSAKAHDYGGNDSVLAYDCYLVKEIKDWLSFLTESDDKTLIDNIRMNSKIGRPCGGKSFIQKIEGVLGRKLNALPKGRLRRRE